MKWSIPAKTFFLGEYAATQAAPAIILTTMPCFEVNLTHTPQLDGIHPDSPAGRLWLKQGYMDKGLSWHDPYRGRGGLGASSAQYLGTWFAIQAIKNKRFSQEAMLNSYFQLAWHGMGVRPSGYDVLAQSREGCVYIHHQQKDYQTWSWPFDDLAFILIHSGQKIATHQHLQSLTFSHDILPLVTIVLSAKHAFESADSLGLINAVNAYHKALLQFDLVATHSRRQIGLLQMQTDVLAIKGCGALGADVLLLLVPVDRLAAQCDHLKTLDFDIIATSQNLYRI